MDGTVKEQINISTPMGSHSVRTEQDMTRRSHSESMCVGKQKVALETPREECCAQQADPRQVRSAFLPMFPT